MSEGRALSKYADFVRTVYQGVLGRDPDPLGFTHHIEVLEAGILDKAQLIASFLQCREFRQREFDLRGSSIIQQIDMGGVFVVVDSTESEFGRAIAQERIWEPNIVNTITTHLRPGHVFVDIGANVGVMSFHAAQVVGAGGKVIAFEPNPLNVQNLLRGVIVNKFEHVVVYPFAVSDRQSVFSLEGSSNTYLIQPLISAELTQSFPADFFLEREERIDFIKIDIEGHEPYALAGLDETLRRHKPMVLCEFNPRCLRDHIGLDKHEFAERLFKLTGAINVIEYNGHQSLVTDAQSLINLWAEKNEEAAASGLLPRGMLHFDLLFRVE